MRRPEHEHISYLEQRIEQLERELADAKVNEHKLRQSNAQVIHMLGLYAHAPWKDGH